MRSSDLRGAPGTVDRSALAGNRPVQINRQVRAREFSLIPKEKERKV